MIEEFVCFSRIHSDDFSFYFLLVLIVKAKVRQMGPPGLIGYESPVPVRQSGIDRNKFIMSQDKSIDINTENTKNAPKCGIIMPISSIDTCPAEHWQDVLRILQEAIADAGYEANLVSDADDSGIIQKRIVQNLYDNDIVVCDVSCKNPNVMFELGMRLAFDKPTIIIIDDKTSYSFDTAIIEHLSYPRDLRYGKIGEMGTTRICLLSSF